MHELEKQRTVDRTNRDLERYRGILEAAGVAIWELDCRPVVRLVERLKRIGVSDISMYLRWRPRIVERLIRGVRVGDVNEEVLRLTGAPDKETARRLGPWAFFKLRDSCIDAVAAVAEGRRKIRASEVIRTLQGEERKVSITLHIPEDAGLGGYVLLCAHDITELDSVRRRYELAIAGGGVSVFEYHIAADLLIVDPHIRSLLALPNGVVRGADLRARIHPDDVERVVSLYEQALRDDAPRDDEGNTPVPEYEFRMTDRDGIGRWFLKRGTVIRDASGRPELLIGTMTDITDRKNMEEAVRVSQYRLRDLAGRLIAAQEEERLRIARDLDDDLNQQLAAIAETLRRLRFDVADQPAVVRAEIRRLEFEIEQVREEIDGLSDAMHSVLPEGIGFISALRSLCAEFGRVERLDVSLRIGSSLASVPRAIGSCLYRVAQEALRNAARHSGSRDAIVRLHVRNGHVFMSIRDHGCGFDPTLLKNRSGLGLISMRERVRLAGGELRIRSRRGRGTVVHIRISLSRG